MLGQRRRRWPNIVSSLETTRTALILLHIVAIRYVIPVRILSGMQGDSLGYVAGPLAGHNQSMGAISQKNHSVGGILWDTAVRHQIEKSLSRRPTPRHPRRSLTRVWNAWRSWNRYVYNHIHHLLYVCFNPRTVADWTTSGVTRRIIMQSLFENIQIDFYTFSTRFIFQHITRRPNI